MSKEVKKDYYIFEMDLKAINVLSVVLFFALLPLCFLLKKDFSLYNFDIVLFLILYMTWLVLHELIHGLSYQVHGGNKKKITYGAYLEKGIFYCLCKQNITRKNILYSLLSPLFYIGIVTLILSFVISSPVLLFLSIANISGSAGDILMFLYISKLNKDIEFSEFDNPTRFAIYADYDVTKTKHIGLKYIEKVKLLKKEDLTKLTISKGSIIAFFIMLLIAIICLVL